MQNLVYQTNTGKSVTKIKTFVTYLSVIHINNTRTHHAQSDPLDNHCYRSLREGGW